MKQFCENTNSFRIIQPKAVKFRYFLPSHLFTFYSLVQLLLPTVKLNGFSQPVAIKYKIVHGLDQTVFRTLNFKMFPVLDLSSFQLCFRTGLKC